MGDEEKKDQQDSETDDNEEERKDSESDDNEEERKDSESDDEEDRNPAREQTESSDKECPECGHPIDNVRVTCINCGYEYKKDDYDDTEVGNEFQAGSALDDEGKEQPDDPSGN